MSSRIVRGVSDGFYPVQPQVSRATCVWCSRMEEGQRETAEVKDTPHTDDNILRLECQGQP
eukprot:4398538-Pyramimonas_sp.AAC.1